MGGWDSSRWALAAVWAAERYGHPAKLCMMLQCAFWPEPIAARTAASALRLEGR